MEYKYDDYKKSLTVGGGGGTSGGTTKNRCDNCKELLHSKYYYGVRRSPNIAVTTVTTTTTLSTYPSKSFCSAECICEYYYKEGERP